MMKGFTIRENIGIGDKVQFSSLPENYFKATGEKLVDISRSWIFDHNPYVLRDVEPESCIELWNFPKRFEWPSVRQPDVYQSNAEIWASLFEVKPKLIRPRLYRFEDYPFEERRMILFQTQGKSHGILPDHVIDHVLKKYKNTGRLYHIGLPDVPDIGIPKLKTDTLWDLVETISKASMLIGVDSGPSWIAACYPDIVIKKIRVRPVHGERPYQDWVPLERNNIHSHWDDRIFQTFYTSEEDIGFMMSYKKL